MISFDQADPPNAIGFELAVAQVQERLGRFDKQVLAREVRALVGAAEYQRVTWAAWIVACVRQAGTEGANGLPKCASVDNKGTYVQQELWTPGDYTFIAERYVNQADASLEKAFRVAAVCSKTFGVDIDVEAMWKARRPA